MQCIEARGLRKTFGATVALDGIDLRIEEGRILGLIGPNGAGMLLRTIRNRSLILANAGGERTRGAYHSLVARQDAEGIRIDGTYEYMSLATVADVVLFKAPLADGNGTVLCAADLQADSVGIGAWRFSGSMRLSDTSSVTFTRHRVPHGYIRSQPTADEAILRSIGALPRSGGSL